MNNLVPCLNSDIATILKRVPYLFSLASYATSSEITVTSCLLFLHGSSIRHAGLSQPFYQSTKLSSNSYKPGIIFVFKHSEEEAAKRCGASAQASAGPYRSCSLSGADMAWCWRACTDL